MKQILLLMLIKTSLLLNLMLNSYNSLNPHLLNSLQITLNEFSINLSLNYYFPKNTPNQSHSLFYSHYYLNPNLLSKNLNFSIKNSTTATTAIIEAKYKNY
jgi:hypothetical protein